MSEFKHYFFNLREEALIPHRSSGHFSEQAVIVRHEHEGGRVPNVRNCLTDEGRSLGIGLLEQIPNHLWRLWSKATVVSAEGKGLGRTRSGVWQEEDCKGTTDDVSKA